MKKVIYKSALAQAIQLLFLGIVLSVWPNQFLELLKLESITDNWLRVFGLFLLSVSYNLFAMSIQGYYKIMRIYNYSIFIFSLIFSYMIYAGYFPTNILIFALLQLGVSIWGWVELNPEK